MARPCKNRNIGKIPSCRYFKPNADINNDDKVVMTVEEYESIRLIDYLGKSQKECADIMQAGRTTIQAIYQSARAKIAKALVEAKPFEIVGSHYLFSIEKESDLEIKNFVSRGESIEMRVAVTYDNGEIFQHFGHTENFKIYDIENNEVKESVVVNTEGQGHGALGGFLKNNQVDSLICGGIGWGAQKALEEAGIKLYGGVSGNADERVKELLAGTLVFVENANCTHHGVGHTCHD